MTPIARCLASLALLAALGLGAVLAGPTERQLPRLVELLVPDQLRASCIALHRDERALRERQVDLDQASDSLAGALQDGAGL